MKTTFQQLFADVQRRIELEAEWTGRGPAGTRGTAIALKLREQLKEGKRK